MSYEQLLMICTVTLWASGLEEINLPCSAGSNIIPDVLWPDIDNGTCSTSVPSCTTSDGYLEIRCCIEGKPSEVKCTKNDSIQDPRCLGNMKSTVGNSNIKVCYEFVNHTSYPFKCETGTGRMMLPDFDILTSIGGPDTGIWLPMEKYKDTFRYATINNFYMDSFGNQSTSNSSARCMILIGGATKAVSCDERHLGICLDFPFIIHQFSESKLDDLLFNVKDICFTSVYRDEFCWYYTQRYHMNLVYFSSRTYIDKPYIILQKSNSRFILQIRKDDTPRSNGTINLHVALTSSDWDIFTNTSFPLTTYDPTDKDIYKAPKLILSTFSDSITIDKSNVNNIKWTQKEESTHYVYCFFTAAPDYQLEKFEVLDGFQSEGRDGVLWCEAFDFDLNVFRSNLITVGDQTIYHYISEMMVTVSIKEIESCDSPSVRLRIIDSFVSSRIDEHIYFDFRNLSVLDCELNKIAKVNVLVNWYPKYPALKIDLIEFEYSKLKTVIQNISEKCMSMGLNITSVQYVRHSNYCMDETTIIGNFSFAWRTTPYGSKAQPYPPCYYKVQNKTLNMERYCLKNSSGSAWSAVTEDCEPTSNLTQLLDIYSGEKFGQTGILHNLNVIIQKYYDNFNVSEVYLLSKIITQLKKIPSHEDKGLGNLSLLVNNLYFIKTDVLKISQDKYQTTDSIMNSSDSLYVSAGGSQNLTDSNHCYYTINFTEHPNATGVILRTLGKNRQIELLESVLPTQESRLDDNFEAAIFFDVEFLKRTKEDENAANVKFSIFFKNYLFDVNHPSATARTIFKVLLPDKKLQTFTSFLTRKNQKKGEICACWKYANIQNSIPESKWYRSTKFDIDSISFCVIKSVSYCTIFSAETQDTRGYIFRLSVEYSYPEDDKLDPVYFVYYAVGNFLDQIQHLLLDKVAYEFEQKTNIDIKQRKHEIVVVWIPHEPTELVAEIEREYNELEQAIYLSAQSLLINKYIDWIVVEYLRHKKYCLIDIYEYKNFTIIFETTPLNKTTTSLPPCYTSNGILQRKCIGNYDEGSYWGQLNTSSIVNCSSNVTEILDYLFKHFQDMDANDVLNSLHQMIAKSSVDFNSRDVYLVSEILFLISNSTENINSQDLSALTSNIQDMDRYVLRDAQQQFNATDQILYSIDRILLKSDISITKENNFFTVELNNLSESEAIILQRNGNDYNVSIIDGASPYEALESYENFESAVLFRDFTREDSIIVSIFFQDVLFVDSTWSHRVSIIFSILLPKRMKESEISGKIELVFKNYDGEDKACAFWKYGIENGVKISGKWRNESEPNFESKFLTCQFNHTTHFAMLIDDSSEDPEYLKIVTNIGCLLSMIGLLGILVTGLIFERWRKNLGNIILMNFVFTVIIQICLFYFSGFIHRVISKSESCILVGALLHYSVISQFSWMLIIAILQFKRFVQVLTRPPKKVLLKSFLIGWGFPVIPVLSVLLIDSSSYSYSETGLCYPSKLGLYLGVWLPILIITVINFIIFFYIMYSIFNRKTECVDTVSNEIIFQWRLAVLLFFMLGLTWSFAFMGQIMFKEIFLYLFCITSTLQGFMMFLFFIVFNERTRLLYSALLKKKLRG